MAFSDLNNSDVDIDIDSPSSDEDRLKTSSSGSEQADELIDSQEEPTTPTPTDMSQDNDCKTQPTQSEVSLSKETRKLRKKKNLDKQDEVQSLVVAKPKTVIPSKDNNVKDKKGKGRLVETEPPNIVVENELQDELMADPVQEEDDTPFEQNSLQEETPPTNHVAPTTKKSFSEFLKSTPYNAKDEEIDELDTDDLLSEIDQQPPLRKTLPKKRKQIKRKQTRRVDLDKLLYRMRKSPTPVYEEYSPARVAQLRTDYPDRYWKFHADSGHNMISSINATNPVCSLPYDISDQGAITGMTLSPDATLLATFSNIGSIKIWDIQNDFALLRKIRDTQESEIDEFYCGQFIEGTNLLVAGGKLKERHRWSAEDQDSHILSCPLKVFDLMDGCKRVARLSGHAEEILCIKTIEFMGKKYFLTTSQDGFIIKWEMEDDWITVKKRTCMADGLTCMAFTISFVPNTGNKYFMAACDEHLRLYDFEQAVLLQTFEDMYSSYCDCGKFINLVDEESVILSCLSDSLSDDLEAKVNSLSVADDKMMIDEEVGEHAYFISRGAEMCDISDGVSSKPNTCTLHKLVYPNKPGGEFELKTIKKFTHEDYHANSWLVKITSNGRYILAPTIYGQIFVFNMVSGKVSAIVKEHEDLEVRDVIFHPYLPLLFSSGDDGTVKVCTYGEAQQS